MARKPMVTRTITSTTVTVFCVNKEDRTTFEQDIVLPRTYKDEKKLMKAVETVFYGEPVKPVSILATVENEQLYGMTEEEFITYAKVLPPRKN